MSSPVEQIKERLDLVELVGSYIKLEKSGSNYRAVCPFHSEKTPSFFVSPARQIWHCFGCNAGGDHFKFVMDIDGLEFPEALRLLADKAGVELKRQDPKLRSERLRLLKLMDEATSFFEENLKEESKVGEYLKSRGMEGEIAKRFRVGFAKDSWDSLLKHLLGKRYKYGEIEKVGLVISKSDDKRYASGDLRYYDRFRSRIMFPIFDFSGRPVGFSGRIFSSHGSSSSMTSSTKDSEGNRFRSHTAVEENIEPAKYINSPQTILYDKSKILYGFDKAKTEIRKQNACVLVEGQMDLIMSHQAGVKNAVALSGTALTPVQIKFIKRLADTLVTSLDMDEAGMRATERSIGLALDSGLEVRAVPLPEGKDPADIIAQDKTKWQNLVAGAKPIISFYLDFLHSKITDGRKLKQEVEKIVLPYVARVSSEIERAHWVTEVARTLGIKEEPVWEELKKINPAPLSKQGYGIKISAESGELREEKKAIAKSRKDLLEERLIGVALWKKGEVRAVLSGCEAEWFSKERRPMFEAVAGGDFSILGEHYPKKLALEAELLYAEMDNFDKELKALAMELRKEHIKYRLGALADEIRRKEQEKDDGGLAAKMDEFNKLSRQLNNR